MKKENNKKNKTTTDKMKKKQMRNVMRQHCPHRLFYLLLSTFKQFFYFTNVRTFASFPSLHHS